MNFDIRTKCTKACMKSFFRSNFSIMKRYFFPLSQFMLLTQLNFVRKETFLLKKCFLPDRPTHILFRVCLLNYKSTWCCLKSCIVDELFFFFLALSKLNSTNYSLTYFQFLGRAVTPNERKLIPTILEIASLPTENVFQVFNALVH